MMNQNRYGLKNNAKVVWSRILKIKLILKIKDLMYIPNCSAKDDVLQNLSIDNGQRQI
jgi:hypothetical protein